MEEEFAAVVRRLYHSGVGSSDFDDAHERLLALQESEEAWELVTKLWEPDSTEEAQFLLAQILYNKVRSQWDTLTAEQQLSFRTCVLDFLKLLADEAVRVFPAAHSRLAGLVSVVAVRCLPDMWPDFYDDLLALLSSTPATSQLLLDILAELPPDYDAQPVDGRGEEAEFALAALVPQLLPLLEEALACEEAAIQVAAFRCLRSWMCSGPRLVTLDAWFCTPLFAAAFDALCVSEESFAVFEAAAQLLVDVLAVNHAGWHEEASEEEDDLLRQALRTSAAHMLELRAAMEAATDDGNLLLCRTLCQIVSVLVTEHAPVLITGRSLHEMPAYRAAPPEERAAMMQEAAELGKGLVDYIMFCTAHPAWEVADLMLDFFYFFGQLLVKAPLKDCYVHLLPDLLLLLCSRVQLPAEDAGWLDDDFWAFRAHVGEAFLGLSSWPGFSSSLDVLVQRLLHAGDDWKQAEASLYSLFNCLEGSNEFYNHVNDNADLCFELQVLIMTVLQSLPEAHNQVMKQTCGKLLEFLAPVFRNDDYDRYLADVFHCAITCLPSKEAGAALEELARSATDALSQDSEPFDVLLSVYNQWQDGYELLAPVLRALATIAGNFPEPQPLAAFDQILTSLLHRIEEHALDAAPLLKLLANVLGAISPPDRAAAVLDGFWPSILELHAAFRSQAEEALALAHVLENALLSTEGRVAGLPEQLFGMLLEDFVALELPAQLQAVSHVVQQTHDVADADSLVAGVRAVIAGVSERCLTILNEDGDPDVVEAFFQLCHTCARHCTPGLEPMAAWLLESTVNLFWAIVPAKPVLRCASSFLTTLMTTELILADDVATVLHAGLPSIVEAILLTLRGAYPTAHVRYVSEMLFSLLLDKRTPQHVHQACAHVMHQQLVEHAGLPMDADVRYRLLTELLRTDCNRAKYRKMLSEVYLVCIGRMRADRLFDMRSPPMFGRVGVDLPGLHLAPAAAAAGAAAADGRMLRRSSSLDGISLVLDVG